MTKVSGKWVEVIHVPLATGDMCGKAWRFSLLLYCGSTPIRDWLSSLSTVTSLMKLTSVSPA